MKINFQVDGVILTSKQKAVMEKKILKLKKKFFHEEPVVVDVILQDASSAEKGGIDQVVHISALIGREKIFIEEKDDRLMRAFAYAFQRFERQLSRHHKRKIDLNQGNGENRLDKLWGVIKRKRKNQK